MKNSRLTYFHFIYDVIIVLLTLVPVMFLNISGLDLINVELALIIIILMALFALHNDSMPKDRTSWLLLLGTGLGILSLAFLFEPIWWRATLLLIAGRIGEVDRLLSSPSSNGNLFVFLGAAICYSAAVGYIRTLFQSMFFGKS